MTRIDQQIFYTALAYIAVYLKEPQEAHQAEPAKILARHIGLYCRENIENIFPPVTIGFVNEPGLAEVDQAIDRHIAELRLTETTILPQDKETLLKFYDRLQQRKARRMHSVFYETVKVGTLLDAINAYFDEEITDMEADQ